MWIKYDFGGDKRLGNGREPEVGVMVKITVRLTTY